MDFTLHIRQLTDQGAMVEADAKDAYLPITYVEPFDRNISLLGVDISRIPRYAELFDDAAQTGRVAASAPVAQTLVAGSREPVVLLAFPLSANSGVGMGYALGILQFLIHHRRSQGPVGSRAAGRNRLSGQRQGATHHLERR